MVWFAVMFCVPGSEAPAAVACMPSVVLKKIEAYVSLLCLPLNMCAAASAASCNVLHCGCCLQTGKSGGSLLQQALLLASAGSITGIMPVMFGVFFLMLRGWRSAVHELSQVRL